mmetsp:Transcript_29181/g.53291  ORF Transcript_29181/g.53291 Transcript_29181/m.53291 type:complete len:210 (-) Transcript_29181:463-1092(-)
MRLLLSPPLVLRSAVKQRARPFLLASASQLRCTMQLLQLMPAPEAAGCWPELLPSRTCKRSFRRQRTQSASSSPQESVCCSGPTGRRHQTAPSFEESCPSCGMGFLPPLLDLGHHARSSQDRVPQRQPLRSCRMELPQTHRRRLLCAWICPMCCLRLACSQKAQTEPWHHHPRMFSAWRVGSNKAARGLQRLCGIAPETVLNRAAAMPH